MLAALWAARQEHPRKLIAAAPVAAPQILKEIERHADETVCLYATPHFLSVGQLYEDFREVSDEELLDILKKEAILRPFLE
jgi:predicted phosphoribosyltransferase